MRKNSPQRKPSGPIELFDAAFAYLYVGGRFALRGSDVWAVREREREAHGCALKSFGAVPAAEVVARPIDNVRRLPTPARLAELRERHASRLGMSVEEYADAHGLHVSRCIGEESRRFGQPHYGHEG